MLELHEDSLKYDRPRSPEQPGLQHVLKTGDKQVREYVITQAVKKRVDQFEYVSPLLLGALRWDDEEIRLASVWEKVPKIIEELKSYGYKIDHVITEAGTAPIQRIGDHHTESKNQDDKEKGGSRITRAKQKLTAPKQEDANMELGMSASSSKGGKPKGKDKDKKEKNSKGKGKGKKEEALGEVSEAAGQDGEMQQVRRLMKMMTEVASVQSSTI